jgi:hypothetical protein
MISQAHKNKILKAIEDGQNLANLASLTTAPKSELLDYINDLYTKMHMLVESITYETAINGSTAVKKEVMESLNKFPNVEKSIDEAIKEITEKKRELTVGGVYSLALIKYSLSHKGKVTSFTMGESVSLDVKNG